jgi:hypothetical protein
VYSTSTRASCLKVSTGTPYRISQTKTYGKRAAPQRADRNHLAKDLPDRDPTTQKPQDTELNRNDCRHCGSTKSPSIYAAHPDPAASDDRQNADLADAQTLAANATAVFTAVRRYRNQATID